MCEAKGSACNACICSDAYLVKLCACPVCHPVVLEAQHIQAMLFPQLEILRLFSSPKLLYWAAHTLIHMLVQQPWCILHRTYLQKATVETRQMLHDIILQPTRRC